jgi:hypothetical protein
LKTPLPADLAIHAARFDNLKEAAPAHVRPHPAAPSAAPASPAAVPAKPG